MHGHQLFSVIAFLWCKIIGICWCNTINILFLAGFCYQIFEYFEFLGFLMWELGGLLVLFVNLIRYWWHCGPRILHFIELLTNNKSRTNKEEAIAICWSHHPFIDYLAKYLNVLRDLITFPVSTLLWELQFWKYDPGNKFPIDPPLSLSCVTKRSELLKRGWTDYHQA